MKRAAHSTHTPFTCPACITLAHTNKMPWHNGYGDELVNHYEEYMRRHTKALEQRINRTLRNPTRSRKLKSFME